MSCNEIPYAMEQGIFWREQGIFAQEQGIWEFHLPNRMSFRYTQVETRRVRRRGATRPICTGRCIAPSLTRVQTVRPL